MDSTRVFVDSINAVVKLSSEVPAAKQEWYANWDNVAIVAIISLSLIAITYIIINGYKDIKKQASDSQIESENKKWERDKNEKASKRQVELQERKLNLLKECCYVEIKATDDKKEKKLKAYNSEEVKGYLNELNALAH